ncbi:hypothetical protein PILCRDRAFT_822456 [Piloderma croceum F 1598]|uniref:Uncharacterized protein n=1 Tax=Piloderma croceum (strain F 1598) TaxID=765440 RepID=A0A0C3FLF2_PILCF|nr:hypothetical protein PILCRDRAFT_822456 [Piloderma croceum F 1598]
METETTEKRQIVKIRQAFISFLLTRKGCRQRDVKPQIIIISEVTRNEKHDSRSFGRSFSPSEQRRKR